MAVGMVNSKLRTWICSKMVSC